MTVPRILLLDPPTRLSQDLAEALRATGFEVEQQVELDAALEALRGQGFDVALGERSLGGEQVLREAQRLADGPPVILLDDFGTDEEASRALREGAFDVLSRPLPHEQIVRAVRRALDAASLRRENRALRSEVDHRYDLGGLESRDPRMRSVFATLDAVADSDATLLFAGESGVGKTMLARAVHHRSARAGGPFVEVNCGALPETLLESELFGHKKGAFTGAVRDRMGKFEAADGGTLFLDEIATASHALQVKLLRVLEDKSFEPVGDERTRRVDVRLVAATNRDLRDEVAAGRFREDLYYRIHVLAVEIPPLRERRVDVPLLAEAFLARFAARHRRAVEGIEPGALEALCAARWPGNVRELENAIERAVLLAGGSLLTRADLGLAEPSADAPGAAAPSTSPWEDLPLGPLKKVLEIPERALILRALEFHAGNRQKTAATLGINRTTLFNKMRKYDLLDFQAGAAGTQGPGQADSR
ncbi:MAG: sigma-54 dependent transcriptional regulator [Planctomycetota bacterium]